MAQLVNMDVATIEDLILALLHDDTVLSDWCKTIDGYDGDVQEFVGELGQTAHRYPALFVFFLRADYQSGTQYEQFADFTFALVPVCATHKGNREARRGLPATDRLPGTAGTYQLMLRLRQLMIGQSFPGTWTTNHFPPFQLVSEVAVLNTRNVSAYECLYITRGHSIRRELNP